MLSPATAFGAFQRPLRGLLPQSQVVAGRSGKACVGIGHRTAGILRGGKARAYSPMGCRMVDVGNEPPVIDLAKLNTQELTLDSEVVQVIAAAASRWGFFQVINHGVDAKLLSDFDRVTKDFFSMEKEEKYKVFASTLSTRCQVLTQLVAVQGETHSRQQQGILR